MQRRRALTINDLTKIRSVSDPQFAPDGLSYSFVSTRINQHKEYESHLYVQELTEQTPRQWTFHQKKDSHPRFSPDGSQIVFQSTRSGTSQIWLLPTDGGEARQITHFKYGASQPYWSKDGKYIIFSARLEPNSDVTQQRELTEEEQMKEQKKKQQRSIVINRLKYKSDAQGLHQDKLFTQIIAYDVTKQTFKQLTKEQTHHYFQDVAPDGQSILFTANFEDADYELTNNLYLLDLTTNQLSKLTTHKGSYGNARFSPNGQQVAFFGHDYQYQGATLRDLYIVDLVTNQPKCISKDWDLAIGDYMIGDTRLGTGETGPVWSKDETKIFFIGTSQGATNLYETDIQGNLKTIYAEKNHVFSFSYHRDSHKFILGISTPTDPGNFYLLEQDQLQPLTEVNHRLLANVALSEPEEISIPTKDGLYVQGWVLRPYGFNEEEKYPLVLQIHGGPHMMYGQTFFHELQMLAAKGYVVLYTNPRGSHGYGQKFVDAVRGDYGNGDYDDLMTAVDYVLENYSFIDKERLGVTGGSYGGFMTNWIIGHTDRFKAAVTQRSISNWLSFYGVSDIGYFFTEWELGYDLLADPKKLWDFSPLKYANRINTPLLILHGEQDLRCPIEQAEQLYVTLKQAKKEVEFVRFPGANHELSRSGDPSLRIERLKHMVRWFNQYL